jgi:hypothetical protein
MLLQTTFVNVAKALKISVTGQERKVIFKKRTFSTDSLGFAKQSHAKEQITGITKNGSTNYHSTTR